MKTKSKWIIWSTVLVLLAFFVWYTFPLIVYYSFIKEKVSNISLKYIDTLPNALIEWDEIDIGGLRFRMPMFKCKKVGGSEKLRYITFDFGTYHLIISDIAPTEEMASILKNKNIKYPTISYLRYLDIVNSSPSDISITNPRSVNMEGVANQILKGMMTNLYEIDIINPKVLKAICQKMVSDKGLYSALVVIYNQNETVCFTMLFGGYRDKNLLQSDLLQILGGIRIPSQRLNIEEVEKGIREVISIYSSEI